MSYKSILISIMLFSASSFLFSLQDKDITNNERKSLFYVENHQYTKAIQSIQRGIGGFKHKDKMLYLLGRSFENNKQLDKALRTFDQLIRQYPDSIWVSKSHFRKVHILGQEKRFAEAYNLLKDRFNVLLDPKRRNELSQIYLKLAKSLSFQKDTKKNDYQKALTFYQRALEMGALKEEEGDTRYRIALCYFYLKKYQDSKKILSQFIAKFPDSPLTQKVHFYLGEIERHLGYLYKSRTHYLKVLKSKKEKDEDLSPKTLYHIGKSYRLPAPYTENELELGVKYWKILIEKYPKHKLAAQVAYEIGISYNRFFHLRDQGIKQLLKFVEVYPKNKNAPIALQLVGNIHFNQKKYDESIVYYTQYLGSYPNHRLWRTVQQQIINAKSTKGNHLYQLKKYSDAERIYQSFLKEYPIESRNPQILYNLGDISFQEKKFEEAIGRWEKLFSKYPNYAIAHKALYSVGKYYSDTTHEFEKAIKTFKKVKHNPWHTMAQNEIRALNTKSLSLETKKLFLSSQKPSIHVKVRNIKEFKVNVYRLDLNEYFSRNHSLKKIEQLDILLIKSDESFTHKVDSYRKHLLYAKDLDLKIDRAGAYVISISSETLKASTLLLVSDLAVSVESNKNEILVYAKNLSKERGEGKAKVYVSNGKKIILEGQTDGQGILHHRFTKPQRKENLNNLTVLVEKNGSYAGTALNNRRFRSHDEKEYLAYIYSDKPVYKPGDSFSYKGIIRMLHRGRLSRIDTGQYRVKFISPTGKTIYEKNVSQSDYGSISGRLSLPETLATGWAKLRIESVKDKTITFEKSFEITKYTKLEKEITFETDKVAYFPRDIIELKITAKHLFGLPAAGKTLFYKIQDESYQSTRMDKDGSFKLKIDSVNYGRRDYISVYAYLEGGKKTFSKSIPIIIKDFSITLNSKRNLYLLDEKGEIEVKTLNYSQKGVSKKLKAKLFLWKDGKEESVSEQDVETNDEGIGQAEFTFQEGGYYTVKVEGMGQNDIPVRSSLGIRVIKKEEKTKLFILSENKSLTLGTKPNITIYSQGESGLALLTIKGKNVISYQLIQIAPGKNDINLILTDPFVPNFQLTVSLLKQEHFHHVSKAFDLEAGINVKVSTDKEVYKPGDTITLNLKTNQHSGEGVSTESSIVLIDEGVLLLTGTRLEDIKRYFYRRRAFPSHSLGGSTPYRYITKTLTRNKVIAGKLKDMEKEANEEIAANTKGFSGGLRRRKLKKTKFDALFSDRERANRPRRPDRSDRLEGESSASFIGGRINRFGQTESGDKSKLKASRRSSQVRQLLPDTAYFNPRVLTDSSGSAQVKIKLPKSHNKWRILVISSTKGSQFGMGEKTITVRKDFVVHLETPLALVEGDQFTFDGDLLNGSKDTKDGELSLIAGDKRKSLNYSVQAKGHFAFQSDMNPVKISHKDSQLTDQTIKVSGVTDYDGEQRLIPVTPWGTTSYKGVSGSTEDTKTVWIPLDDSSVKNKSFTLTLYPGFNQALTRIHDLMGHSSYTFVNHVASHLITKLSLYEYLSLHEKERLGDIKRLKAEIQAKIGFLISTMDPSGGWHWIFRRGSQDNVVSAYVYSALGLAKSLKFKVNKKRLATTTRYLNKSFSSLSNQDLETKIFLLFALSMNGKANYSYVNRIYRNRGRLTLRGLNLLALTLHNMKRKGEAKQILSLIEAKVKNPDFDQWMKKKSSIPYLDFLSSKDEIIALSVLSFLKIKRYKLKAKPFLIKLLTSLSKDRYVTGEFLALLSQSIKTYLIQDSPSQNNFQLTAKWNDKVILKKKMSGIHSPQSIRITDNIIDKNKLELRLEGKGEVFYSGTLSYFKPNVIHEDVKKHGYLTKTVKYPKYKLGSKEFKSGWNVIQANSFAYKVQSLNQVAQHTIFPVSIRLKLYKSMPERYFILEDTIPAGSTLLQGSIKGGFEYYKQEKNKLIFYLKRRSLSQNYIYLDYKLISRFQGTYKTLPPEAYPIRNRQKIISGKVTKLTIENQAFSTFKDYKFSPDELYHVGKYYFDHDDYAKSEELLTKVFTAYTLKDKFYKEACRMFLYISLKKKDSREVVKYFELLKERYPTLTIPFKDVIQIADSYSSIEEYERAIQVLNGTIRSYFVQEVALPGTLSGLKKVKEAYPLMVKLLMDYPDYPVVLKAYYAFGQEIYLRYTEKNASPNKKKNGDISTDELFNIARSIFHDYLVYYPDDWNSDEVSFTLLNLYLDNNKLNPTIDNALLYVKRFPKSHFLDGYKYIAAHALFNKGDYRLARELSQSVAYDKFPGQDGLHFSDNKHFAMLMLAKIFHHQKDFIKALEVYEKISDQFEEAKRSVEFIQEKKIIMKEVTQIKTNEKNVLELMFKGVNKVSLKLYRVNFTILCLKEKNLSNITKINLSGIKPFFIKNYTLSPKIPYTPRKIKIPLPIKKVGAYLLVFKAKNVQGSGIILKSDLSFDTIEKTDSGRTRVTVLDRKNNFVKDVTVKFIGIGKDQYQAAKTDLRGTAEVDHFSNLSLVVGEKNGHYCFYRGKQPIALLKRGQNQPRPKSPAKKSELGLKNIYKRRGYIQQSNRAYWNENTDDADIKGVEIQAVK